MPTASTSGSDERAGTPLALSRPLAGSGCVTRIIPRRSDVALPGVGQRVALRHKPPGMAGTPRALIRLSHRFTPAYAAEAPVPDGEPQPARGVGLLYTPAAAAAG